MRIAENYWKDEYEMENAKDNMPAHKTITWQNNLPYGHNVIEKKLIRFFAIAEYAKLLEDIQKIKSSKGCATLLDGGAVFIKGLKNNVSVEGYTRVSDISMEKRQLPTKKQNDEN